MKKLTPFLILLVLVLVLSGCVSILWTKNVDVSRKFVSFTFDDGPNGAATLKTLEVLKKHNVKAAFFVIGKNVEKYPKIAKQIVAGGHIIGNHSYNHHSLFALNSKKYIKDDLTKANQLIQEITGVTPAYFRPPSAIVSKKLKKICDELNLKLVGVNAFSKDSFDTNADAVVKKCLKAIRKSNGGIVVLHDGFATHDSPSREVIPEALEYLIPRLKERGYEFIPLDQVKNLN